MNSKHSTIFPHIKPVGCSSLTCPTAQQRAAVNVQSQVRVGVAKHCDNQTNHQHQFQQTLQDLSCNGNIFLWTKPTTSSKSDNVNFHKDVFALMSKTHTCF